MGLIRKFLNQTRKPEGFLGKMMLRGMNSGHARLADWGMECLPSAEAEIIADLGCGAGRNAGELLKKYPHAHLTAVDHSQLSVEKTREYNRKAVEEKRCSVLQGDVSALSMESDSVDLATAFETVYFWPGPLKSFSEVFRILKPGGIFLICNESDGKDKTGTVFQGVIDGMKCYTAEQIETTLKSAGFSEIKSEHHAKKPWIRVLARK